ncbi:MAG: hypothetical protein GVY36_19755 [Verrucomicrobia bacterium]|nr:hypothetical protein [Verrucomicrobiota bacterium]
MNPYIIIALTTYSDLNADRFGADLFSAIGEVEPRLLPQKAGWLGTLSRDVKTSEDFASLWREDRQIYTSERRGGTRRTTGGIMGVEWARRSAIKNKGKIVHRGVHYSNQAEALVLHAEWRERVDWLKLFQQLCLLTRAAHGMMHLFTPEEIAELDPDDRSLYRREGFHGQNAFTYSIDSYGTRRKLGPGDPNMRVFRQVPDLTWATWLGTNFNEQYDLVSLKSTVANATETKDGFLFTVTDQLGDVLRNFATFQRRRELVKANGFPKTFFPE